jgi:hypothetical protein
MKAQLSSILTLLLFSTTSGGSELEIDRLSGGTLRWSNTVPNAVYQVECRAELTRGVWSNQIDTLRPIISTNAIIEVDIPQYFRITATTYLEETDEAACYQMYSNALLDAAIALPEEISTDLLPLLPESPGTEWRTFANWVDGTTSQWVKVNTMLYRGDAGWTWNSLLVEGEVTLTDGWSNEIWITPCPQLRELCAAYTGTHQRLRMQKALGLPPRSGDYGVVEFFIDPKYLFRPTPDRSVVDCSAGLASATSRPYLTESEAQGVTAHYADWFRNNYDYSGYEATNDLNASWPWTRLGYTYDYANTPNHPVGLSEYVIIDPSQTQYWGTSLSIPLYVDGKYNAETYGK